MKKILMIIPPKNYRNEELDHPKSIFLREGYSVTVASKGTSLATGMLGGTTSVSLDISQVKVPEYNAIVFVGGSGAKEYFDDETAHSIAKEAVKLNKVVGAICIAPSILANAGLLKGMNATAFPSEKSNLEKKGADFSKSPVISDKRIVTAIGPNVAKEFAIMIVDILDRMY